MTCNVVVFGLVIVCFLRFYFNFFLEHTRLQMDLEKVEQVRRNIKYMYFPCYSFEFLHYLIVSKVMMCLHWFCFFWSFLKVLFLLANQSTDSGHSNQSGATKRFSDLCFPALCGAGYTFAVRSTLNSFGLVSGLFSFTTSQRIPFSLFIDKC